jgi:Secretion system C-terminal sorting domain
VYSLNMNSLMATGLWSANAFHASDLGGSAVLKNRREHDDENENNDRFITLTDETGNDKIQLYPNPVTGNEFKIQFSGSDAGNYTVDVIDVKGQLVANRIVSTSGKNSTAVISLPSLTARGIFIVRVTDKNNRTVFSDKIILQ